MSNALAKRSFWYRNIRPNLFNISNVFVAVLTFVITYFVNLEKLNILSGWGKLPALVMMMLFSFAMAGSAAMVIKWIVIKFCSKKYLDYIFKSYLTGKKILDATKSKPKVLILYPTCDDFMEYCANKCIEQTYENLLFCILDDSRTEKFKEMVDNFAKGKKNVIVYRRPVKHGWKGGNVTDFLKQYDKEWDYYVIMDADTYLPKNFVESNIALFLDPKNSNVGYIQSMTTAYKQPSLFSRTVRDRINSQTGNKNIIAYSNFGPICGYIDWGTVVSKKIWDTIKDEQYPDIVNCDTWFLQKYFQSNFDLISSSLTVVSSLEPLDEIAYYNREKRWWLSQIEIFRKCKGMLRKIFRNKKRSAAENLRIFSDYAAAGLYKVAFWLVITTFLFPLCFIYTPANDIVSSLLTISTLVWLGILVLFYVYVCIVSKSILYAVRYYLAMLIYSANCFKISFIFVARVIFNIKSKIGYYVSPKTYSKLSLWTIIKFNKQNIFCFCLFMSLAFFFMFFPPLLNIHNFNSLGISISLFILSFQFLILIGATFLSNITINKNDSYEYDVFYRYDNYRKKYGVPLEK